MGELADLRNAFLGNFGLSVSLGPFVLAIRRSKHATKYNAALAEYDR